MKIENHIGFPLPSEMFHPHTYCWDMPENETACRLLDIPRKCHVCNKILYPWSLTGYGIEEDNFFWGYKKTQAFYFCLNECYL